MNAAQLLEPTDESEGARMLMLTRKVGEKVMIGDDVEIMVTEIRGGQVKLGITAPAHIAVHRLEIWKRIRDGIESWRSRPGSARA